MSVTGIGRVLDLAICKPDEVSISLKEKLLVDSRPIVKRRHIFRNWRRSIVKNFVNKIRSTFNLKENPEFSAGGSSDFRPFGCPYKKSMVISYVMLVRGDFELLLLRKIAVKPGKTDNEAVNKTAKMGIS